jgi:hypothetical protein
MTEPDGILSLPLEAAREIIAASTEFQTWTGTASEAAAKERVWPVETPPTGEDQDIEEVAPSPLAIVDYGAFVRERYTVTNSNLFQHSTAGSDVAIYFRAKASGDLPDAVWNFTNAVGAIIEDMEAWASELQGESLAINRVELTQPPMRVEYTRRERDGDYWECVVTIGFTRQPVRYA